MAGIPYVTSYKDNSSILPYRPLETYYSYFLNPQNPWLLPYSSIQHGR